MTSLSTVSAELLCGDGPGQLRKEWMGSAPGCPWKAASLGSFQEGSGGSARRPTGEATAGTLWFGALGVRSLPFTHSPGPPPHSHSPTPRPWASGDGEGGVAARLAGRAGRAAFLGIVWGKHIVRAWSRRPGLLLASRGCLLAPPSTASGGGNWDWARALGRPGDFPEDATVGGQLFPLCRLRN